MPPHVYRLHPRRIGRLFFRGHEYLRLGHQFGRHPHDLGDAHHNGGCALDQYQCVVLYSGHNHFGLAVTAYGEPGEPWSYFWQSNGITVAVTTITPATNGFGTSSQSWVNTKVSATYSCIVSNSYGTVTNANALAVTLVAPPVTPYASALLSLNPFAYWPMDETSSGFTYDYLSGNNGAPLAVSTYQVGQPGPVTGFENPSLAYTFDGAGNPVDVRGPTSTLPAP